MSVLSVKAAPPWLAALCRSSRKPLPLVTSDGSMLPLLALLTRPETAAENFAIGAARSLHRVGLASAAFLAASSRLTVNAPAAAALTRARTRPLSPYLNFPALAGV